jgi:hypothetical protein
MAQVVGWNATASSQFFRGLDAKTSGGSVSTELPVTVVGEIEHGRLQGPVNEGGKSVQLRSGGGNIHLKKL